MFQKAPYKVIYKSPVMAGLTGTWIILEHD